MTRRDKYIGIIIAVALLLLFGWISYSLLVATDSDGSTTTRTTPTSIE